MFYSNNNSYMQDLYAYNQIPVNSTYPYMSNNVSNAGNENMGFNIASCMNPGMFMPNMNTLNNPNMFQGNNNMQNPNNLYPSIYRIINPVVNRVVSGANVQHLNEDSLNNLVDTVYNIVEGQIDLEEQLEQPSIRNEVGDRASATTTTTTTNTPNQSSNTNTRTTTTTDTRNVNNTNNVVNSNSNSRRNNRNDSLLRDLIKILILRQLFSRNWMQQMPFNYQNQFGYNPNFMTQGVFPSGF